MGQPPVLNRLAGAGQTQARAGLRTGRGGVQLAGFGQHALHTLNHVPELKSVSNPLPAGFAHGLAGGRVLDQAAQLGHVPLDFVGLITARNQRAARGSDQLALSAHVGPNNGQTAGHGFVDRQGNALPLRGQKKYVGSRHQLLHALARDCAQ